VTRFCVQAPEHRDRLVSLGVAPQRVVVTGSLKGDARAAESPAFLPALEALGRPVVSAGSTHPGEDEAVLAAAAALREGPTPPVWILAPRHPERFAPVATLLASSGLRFVRRSEITGVEADPHALRSRLDGVDVLLLDTIGELAGCYPAATTAFVGATLVPIGGHNLLEAARWGVPVIVGPHLDTVRRIADRLLAAGGATVVSDGATLAAAVRAYLEPGQRGLAGAAARQVANEESGSLDATWTAIEDAARERGAAR
jgi:3-deoxy-D-manno-octulosonic-acid transferase